MTFQSTKRRSVFDIKMYLNILQRYYGKSLPFGNDSFTRENIGYLTIEQALADYSYLIQYLKKKYDAHNSPVIAFGGRYALAFFYVSHFQNSFS